MRELSLYILDIAQNSFASGASVTEIFLDEDETRFSITLRDDGCGIEEKDSLKLFDPFYTTKSKQTGLGLPLFRQGAEMTGGSASARSSTHPLYHGTEINGIFYKNHIDCPPLGDMASTICLLAVGCGDGNVLFSHKINEKEEVVLDTREIRKILGAISLAEPKIVLWIKEHVKQQYKKIKEI